LTNSEFRSGIIDFKRIADIHSVILC